MLVGLLPIVPKLIVQFDGYHKGRTWYFLSETESGSIIETALRLLLMELKNFPFNNHLPAFPYFYSQMAHLQENITTKWGVIFRWSGTTRCAAHYLSTKTISAVQMSHWYIHSIQTGYIQGGRVTGVLHKYMDECQKRQLQDIQQNQWINILVCNLVIPYSNAYT